MNKIKRILSTILSVIIMFISCNVQVVKASYSNPLVLLVSTPGVNHKPGEIQTINTAYKIKNLNGQSSSFTPGDSGQGFIFNDDTVKTYYPGIAETIDVYDKCYGGTAYLKYTGDVGQLVVGGSTSEYSVKINNELYSTSKFHYLIGDGSYGGYQHESTFDYSDFKKPGCEYLAKLNVSPIQSDTVAASGGDYGFGSIHGEVIETESSGGNFLMLFYVFELIGSSGSGGGSGDDEEPDMPEPPKASGKITIGFDTEDLKLPYRSAYKTVKATASIKNTSSNSDEEDEGINWVKWGDNEYGENPQEYRIIASNFNKVVNTIEVTAQGWAEASNDSGTDRDSNIRGSSNFIFELINTKPDIKFEMKPTNGETFGLIGTNEYIYYSDKFYDIGCNIYDYEGDIDDVKVSIYTYENGSKGTKILEYLANRGNENIDKSFTADNVYVNCTNSNADITDYIRDDEPYITSAVVSINNINFPEGKYIYRIEVIDGYSLTADRTKQGLTELISRTAKEGTINVTGSSNQPPVADITSTEYAFENSTYKISQRSTDPNGVADIKTYDWSTNGDGAIGGELVYVSGPEGNNKENISINYNNSVIAYKEGSYGYETDETYNRDSDVWENTNTVSMGNLELVDEATYSSNIKRYTLKEVVKNTHGTVFIPKATSTTGGTSNNVYKLNLKVTDRANNTDSDSILITVMPQDFELPIASLSKSIYKYNGDSSEPADVVKTNRLVRLDSTESQVNKAVDNTDITEREWKITNSYGNVVPSSDYILKTIKGTDDNAEIMGIQFSKAGTYKIQLTCHNNYTANALNNPNYKYKQYVNACKTEVSITVVEDKQPNVGILNTSEDFTDKNMEYTVSLTGTATATDSIGFSDWFDNESYEWKISQLNGNTYEDITNNEKVNIKANKIDFKTEYKSGGHNMYQIEFKATEYYGEETDAVDIPNKYAGLSSGDEGDMSTLKIVTNWIPSVKLDFVDEGKVPKYEPLENQDETLKEDGTDISSENYIKAYTDDTFKLKVTIDDELPQEIKGMSWELRKIENNSSTKVNLTDTRVVSENLPKTKDKVMQDGTSTGTLNIKENGIYELLVTVTDDYDCISTDSIYIRIYAMPIASLIFDSLNVSGENWTTRENVQFNIKATDNDSSDAYGPLWHKIDNSKDAWNIEPQQYTNTEGTVIAIDVATDVHVMNSQYTSEITNSTKSDNKFTPYSSDVALNNCVNSDSGTKGGRAFSFTDKEHLREEVSTKYTFKYQGTNEVGKKTEQLTRTITVENDEGPVITPNEVLKYYRNINDSSKATLAIGNVDTDTKTGNTSYNINVQSEEGDYITGLDIEMTYDANNDGEFGDNYDITAKLAMGEGTVQNQTYSFDYYFAEEG